MITIENELLMDLRTFLKFMDLDCERLDVFWSSGAPLLFDQEVEPIEFLKFSEDDLLRGDKQGLVNALTNAKRAIDSQIDKIFGCFGILKQRNFPQKMQILQDMGLVAPRIIVKVSKLRNLLEHEYKLPDKEQVEDAVDIADLFVLALDSNLDNFPDTFYIRTFINDKKRKGDNELVFDKEVEINFDENEHKFVLEGYILDTDNFIEEHGREYQKVVQKVGQVLLPATEQGYLQIIGIASKSAKPYNVKNDVSKFVKMFNQV